jgi:hypothetical protein
MNFPPFLTQMIRGFSGRDVSVPKMDGHVNYAAGTSVNFQGEFSNGAHDARAARTQALFAAKPSNHQVRLPSSSPRPWTQAETPTRRVDMLLRQQASQVCRGTSLIRNTHPPRITIVS